MRFKSTPFTQNDQALDHPEMVLAPTPHNHRVGAIDEYDARQEIEVEAESAHAATEDVWKVFQNINEDHCTPDNGRSLMTGDLVRIIGENGAESWWICCLQGWHQIDAPTGSERIA